MAGEAVERWAAPDLSGVVACVTGASYGVGRGIAEVLGECGATVYVSARSTREAPSRAEGWSVDETAELVRLRGGVGIPVGVDHTVENEVGVRSLFLAAKAAMPVMLRKRRGLIVATQERPGDDDRFGQNIVVDAAAMAMKRMIEHLAHEAAGSGVAALLVYLGWVRSVNMGMGFDPSRVGMSQEDLIEATESPHLVGRAIAMLAADPAVAGRSGQTVYAGDLAREYSFTDVDGRTPTYDRSEGHRAD